MELGFDEFCVHCKCCALVYMALTVGGMYWRRTGLLLHMHVSQSGRYWRHGGVNKWDSPRTNLGFYEPYRRLTREFSNLGLKRCVLAYMSLVVGDTH